MDAKVRACLKNNSQKGYILKRITVCINKKIFKEIYPNYSCIFRLKYIQP
jgi:hypothetical protein